jgi:hypothetical protein
MKLIIAGSRILNVYPTGISGLLDGFEIEEIEQVVSGTANGIDRCGENFADFYEIDIETFPADWDKHGKPAGHIRNKEMADYADALLLIWDGESRGSANMKENMLKLGKPVYEVILKKHEARNLKEKCKWCNGRGIVDLPGEPDVGWGNAETCPKCGGAG